MTRLRTVAETVAVVGAVAAFLALATHQIDLPGLYYDEAADAIPAMQIVLGQPVELFRGAGVRIGDQTWPLVVMDYVGAVSTYLLIGSIAIFGVTVEAVRAMPIAFGAVALLLAYGFLRGAVGVPAAVIALWLVAVTPSFVFWTRQGVHVSSIMLVCSTAALWLLLAWWRRGGWWRLALAGLMLGLGVSIKLLFIWFPVALVATALVLRPPWVARRFWVTWRDAPGLLAGAALFVVGAGFIILYNVQTQGTITVLAENATTTSYGVDNRAFLPNLLTRLDAFGAYLRGENFWYFGQLFANPITVGVFMGAVFALLALVALDPVHRARWRVPAFFAVMIVFIVAQSTVTVSSLSATHFYLLYPLPHAMIALAIVWAAESARRWAPRARLASPTAVGAAVCVVGAVVALDLKTVYDYHTTLARTGGVGNYSDSINDLTEYLVEWTGHHAVAMDWGIAKSVQYLSRGKVNPPELFGYTGATPPPGYVDMLYGYAMRPNTLWVFHDLKFAVYPREDHFFEAARAARKRARPEIYITQRDERIIFVLFTLRD